MKKGFTLSEVLITLGILGIVAVLTIPGVMKNYKNRLYTAQLQKVYAQVSDAVQAIMNEEHVDSYLESKASANNSCTNANTGDCTAGVAYLLNTYMKPVKRNCQTGTNRCLPATYSDIESRNSIEPTSGMGYCIQTTNGATICGTYNSTNKITSVFMDVNGPASPNMFGRDVFSVDIQADGTLADRFSGVVRNNCPMTVSSGNIYGRPTGCLNAIIEAGWKMEY
ncbi:type II secretion system protein [bacterium]|nr:type II secretion system protein [bacterium]